MSRALVCRTPSAVAMSPVLQICRHPATDTRTTSWSDGEETTCGLAQPGCSPQTPHSSCLGWHAGLPVYPWFLARFSSTGRMFRRLPDSGGNLIVKMEWPSSHRPLHTAGGLGGGRQIRAKGLPDSSKPSFGTPTFAHATLCVCVCVCESPTALLACSYGPHV